MEQRYFQRDIIFNFFQHVSGNPRDPVLSFWSLFSLLTYVRVGYRRCNNSPPVLFLHPVLRERHGSRVCSMLSDALKPGYGMRNLLANLLEHRETNELLGY